MRRLLNSGFKDSLLTMGLCERGDDPNNGSELLRINQNGFQTV